MLNARNYYKPIRACSELTDYKETEFLTLTAKSHVTFALFRGITYSELILGLVILFLVFCRFACAAAVEVYLIFIVRVQESLSSDILIVCYSLSNYEFFDVLVTAHFRRN